MRSVHPTLTLTLALAATLCGHAGLSAQDAAFFESHIRPALVKYCRECHSAELGESKGGLSYGETDEHGYEAVAGKVRNHDWHATILNLPGLNHERLTFRHAGREMRLTDVKGRGAPEILA